MIYARHRRRSLTLIVALISLLIAGSGSAFARRAYSYGSSTTETAVSAAPSSATTAATSKAISKDDISTVVHKTSAPVKKTAAKKHTEARLDVNADDDSILNVFAPAPMNALPAKVSTKNRTNDKSVVVAREKK